MGCWGIKKKAPITQSSRLFSVFFLNTHIYPYVRYNVTMNNVMKITWLHSITERSLQCQTANLNLYWNKESNFYYRGWFFSQLPFIFLHTPVIVFETLHVWVFDDKNMFHLTLLPQQFFYSFFFLHFHCLLILLLISFFSIAYFPSFI